MWLTFFFFFNDTATTEIYTLSLHDALPISRRRWRGSGRVVRRLRTGPRARARWPGSAAGWRAWPVMRWPRSEEHTSELQSRLHLACRLLLVKNIMPQVPTRSAREREAHCKL